MPDSSVINVYSGCYESVCDAQTHHLDNFDPSVFAPTHDLGVFDPPVHTQASALNLFRLPVYA